MFNLNNKNVAPVEEKIPYEEFKKKVSEYQGKLDSLRKDGVSKVQSLKLETASIKRNKNISDDVKKEIIEKNNAELVKAKEVAKNNAEEIKAVLAEATKYVNENYKAYHFNIALNCKEEKLQENARYQGLVLELKEKHAEKINAIKNDSSLSPEDQKQKISVVLSANKQEDFEEKSKHKDALQKIKDRKHNSAVKKLDILKRLNGGKDGIVEIAQRKFENYVYNFELSKFLLKNGLYIIIIIFMIGCIIANNSLISANAISLILKNFSTKIFFALGVAGLILLAGTDLSVGRMVTLGSMITCMILNPTTEVTFFGLSLTGIYTSLGFVGAAIVALLLSIIACTLFSSIAGFFSAKFKIHPFVSTLATSLVIWGLVGYGTNNIKTGTISNEALGIANNFWSGNGFVGIPLTLIYAIVAIFIVWFIWNKTKFGKNMYAVGGNAEAASVSGISVFWTTLGVFIMAGVLYGFGGFFQATVTGSSSSSLGQGWEMEAIAACVIGGISFTGGIGKISGAVIGCLLFEILKYYLRQMTGGSADIANIFIGIVILVAVTFDSVKYLKKK